MGRSSFAAEQLVRDLIHSLMVGSTPSRAAILATGRMAARLPGTARPIGSVSRATIGGVGRVLGIAKVVRVVAIMTGRSHRPRSGSEDPTRTLSREGAGAFPDSVANGTFHE